jgi:hypothetical protein
MWGETAGLKDITIPSGLNSGMCGTGTGDRGVETQRAIGGQVGVVFNGFADCGTGAVFLY